jgi:dTDP-4-amino-4,6-dideoxygalactose transaminase
MREEFLVFGRPAIEEPEIAEVVATLRSGWIGTGPRVARFEDMFREYIGARHAVAVNSCTAALHLSMVAAGVGPGDEVITTPLTFCATANAVVHTGATPVFADVDPVTGNIDPTAIERAITPRTRALLPVHYAGRPCPMDRIEGIARRHGLVLVEDAAHAIEASVGGRKIGTIGDLTCFSFYVTKNVITAEGGMVTTQDPDLAARIKVSALHGMSADAWKRFSDRGYRHYEVTMPGFKYNMTDIQAALGLHQLPRVGAGAARRRAIWERYDEAFAGLPLVRPAPVEAGAVHARHLYTILVEDRLGKSRDRVLDELIAMRIGTGVHYTALHLHRYYRERWGYKRGDFPAAEHIGDRTLSLPLSAGLTDADVGDVIAAVRAVCGG